LVITVPYVTGRGWILTEQELLDMFIQERINMLLLNLEKTNPKRSPEKEDKLIQAEHFINTLPRTERELIQNYIDNILNYLFVEEPFLYQNGFWDTCRVMNFLKAL